MKNGMNMPEEYQILLISCKMERAVEKWISGICLFDWRHKGLEIMQLGKGYRNEIVSDKINTILHILLFSAHTTLKILRVK